jgi:hypothetical protein
MAHADSLKPKSVPSGSTAKIIRILAVVIGVVLVCVSVLRVHRSPLSPLDAFRGHLDQYVSIPDLKDGPGGTSISKKILPIDKTYKTIELGVYNSLPVEMRATKPQEVGTVVWVVWGQDRYATWVNTSTGAAAGTQYVRTCEVTVIDLSARRIIGRRSFRGAPRATDRVGDSVGDIPLEQVTAYLKTLFGVTVTG